MIIGSAGAGKTTLAVKLGEILQLSVIHLDAHFWKPGWTPSDADDWKEKVEQLIQGECWIMDGNYGGTMEVRIAAADTVVFLDFSRVVCLYRVLKRSLRHRGNRRPDLGDGCPEQLPDWEFLRWIWNYPGSRTPKVLSMLAAQANKTTVVLRSPRDVDRFLIVSRTTSQAELINRAPRGDAPSDP
jgi:adenylate kinase family enzyme